MASGISVRYQSIPLPDWFFLFRFLTGSGICICNNSGTGLTGCRKFRPSGIPAFKTKLLKIRCTCRNAGKSKSGIGIFTDNPAAAFRHQGHSGTDGRKLLWHCPAKFKTWIMLKQWKEKAEAKVVIIHGTSRKRSVAAFVSGFLF
jgi:hypothetical protein